MTIHGWHAHLYYSGAQRAAAEAVSERLAAVAAHAVFGRWHDAPVGPHPRGSRQIGFGPDLLGVVLPWLVLHRAGLTVLVHPETGDAMTDHTAHAIWLGAPEPLRLDALRAA